MKLVGAVITVSFLPLAALAGPIQSACLKSDRQAASRSLCTCIQQAADMTLTGSDQRRAAKFFRDPDEAQDVRMSKSDNDNAFWARYRSFGDMAEAYCAG
ncbi:hypothetical protein [Szabonella alba]|uniref:Arginine transporter n=1 Tax=Szabonella alba TaxID=2804194 RepID=A0A8K0VDI9_9RHOB|nr:hypothetical protein [Szabonella alba]